MAPSATGHKSEGRKAGPFALVERLIQNNTCTSLLTCDCCHLHLLYRPLLFSVELMALNSAFLSVNMRSWNPHIASEAACSKQLPSPVVARGSSRWQAPRSAHQFNRPENVKQKQNSKPTDIRHAFKGTRRKLFIMSRSREKVHLCCCIETPFNVTTTRKPGAKKLTRLFQRHQGGRLNQVFVQECSEVFWILAEIRQDERILWSFQQMRSFLEFTDVVQHLVTSFGHNIYVFRRFRDSTFQHCVSWKRNVQCAKIFPFRHSAMETHLSPPVVKFRNPPKKKKKL